MLNPKNTIEIIIDNQKEFTYSDIKNISQSLNKQEEIGLWEVAVQHYAYKESTHLSLFFNNSDSHPTYRFIAISSGVVKENKAVFKLKDFSQNPGKEKLIVW